MENVHKTRNLGALARTCDAVGIGTIHAVASVDASIKLGRKTAGGTEKWIGVRRYPTVEKAYGELRAQGFTLLAADVGEAAVDYRSVDYTRPTIIVVGSELDGLSAAAAGGADGRIHVPVKGMVESLNVSVAAGIILYEAARQREKAGMYSERRIDEDEYVRLLFEWLHPAVARYCRERQLPYPTLDEYGEIRDAVSGNRRDGLSVLASTSRGN
jgi:tRNA (guanosine-2'-O-)-methyltransferase